jgi:hypothetical protein
MEEKNMFHRRRFLTVAALTAAGGFIFDKNSFAQSRAVGRDVSEDVSLIMEDTTKPQKPPKPPALSAETVKIWVSKAHSDLEYIQMAFLEEPNLLNASWDWGGGDYETALEAAGHVGNKEVARFLLGKGARMNIFCAAMLGQLEVVKTILTAFPDLKESKGPHGLQLIHHAKKGGEEAKAVLDYLNSIGAK